MLRSSGAERGSVRGYKLLQPIGEGGFGSVFLAEQLHPVKRRVALKLIKRGMDSRQVVARFEAERQALAIMDHPNIAKVFDGGCAEDGRPFFVMELVKGVPITHYCDENKLSTAQRLELFVQVCHAVQHAHQKGIIHRDLKPSNVLVTLFDGRPVPKVIDFGIAKALNQELTEKTLFTEFRQFMGTPEYMSPEQAGLSALDVDTRSDVYSLGVLLYELLTGTTPFEQMRLRQAAYAEIERIIKEVEPPRPSTRLSTMAGDRLHTVADRRQTEARRLRRTVRGELDWIVMRCLEKDRTRRYDTANSLALDVQRHLSGDAVLAGPPSTAYRLKKFTRKHRLGLSVAAASVAGLMVMAAVVVSAAVREARQRGRHVAELKTERDHSRRHAAEAEAVSSFLQEMFRSANPHAGGNKDLTVRQALDEAARKLEAASLKDQPSVEAAVRATVGMTYESLGCYGQAEQHLSRAVSLYRGLAAAGWDVGRALATCLHGLGHAVEKQGDLARAEALMEEALAVERKLHLEADPEVPHVLTCLSNLLRERGDLDRAEAAAREGLATARKLAGPGGEHLSSSLSNLASILGDKGDDAGAASLHRESLALNRRLLGTEHPDVAAAMNNLAVILVRQGARAEALALHRDAVGIARKALGPQHPALGTYLLNLGELLAESGDLAGAESMLQEALAVRRNTFGSEHSDVAAVQGALANVLSDKGNLPAAESLYREALATKRRVLGPNHPGLFVLLNNFAKLLRARGDLDGAETLDREALAIIRDRLGPEHPKAAMSLQNLGVTLSHKGQHAAAEPLLREALMIRRKLFGPDHPDVAQSLGALGATLAGKGDLAAAEPILREALAIQGRLGTRHSLEAAHKLHNLSALLQRRGHFAAAEPPLRESMAILRNAHGSEHPEVVDDLRVLGHLSARLGNFPQALSDVEAYLKVKPDDHVNWFLSGCLRLYLGDEAGYRDDCREMFKRFGGIEGAPGASGGALLNPLRALGKVAGVARFDPRVADRTAKTCLLLPDALAPLARHRLTELMDAALASDDHGVMAFFQMGKGMAEYRAGRHADAVQWLTRALEGMGTDPGSAPATAQLFLAMARHGLGEPAEAAKLYHAAAEVVDRTVPRAGTADLGPWPQDWLICHIIRREAQRLIQPAEARAGAEHD